MTRLPFSPVMARLMDADSSRPGEPSVDWLCDHLGTYSRKLRRWRNVGLTCWEAEDVARTLGLHPSNLWGFAWDECVDLDVGEPDENYDDLLALIGAAGTGQE